MTHLVSNCGGVHFGDLCLPLRLDSVRPCQTSAKDDPDKQNRKWQITRGSFDLLCIVKQLVADRNISVPLCPALGLGGIVTQSCGAREEFNKMRYLTLMIYSHFMFRIMRLVVFLVDEGLGWMYAKLAVMSILLSLHVLITIVIYFLPKLVAVNKDTANEMDNRTNTSTAVTAPG